MSRRLTAIVAVSCALAAACSSSTAFAFVQSGSVTVQKVGNGYVGGGGIDCGSTCTVTVPYGNCDTSTKPPVCEPGFVTVTAQDANGFAFDHWDGCDLADGRDCSTTALSEGSTVTASFRDVQAPTVTLTAPSSGGNGFITRVPDLTADASDNVGVDHVDFYVRGVKIASDPSAPYLASFDTSTVPDGPAVFEARAVDAAGNVSASSAVTLSIDNTPPDLTITSGPDQQTFAPGTAQTWTYTASDATSAVTGVLCSVDGAGYQDCPSPWSVTSAGLGFHTVSFAAVDMLGNVRRIERSWTIAVVPAATGKPKISGTAQAGKVLATTLGTWAGEPDSYNFSWLRCNTIGTGCVPINTADSMDADYTVTSADTGHTIRVDVTASTAAGSATSRAAATTIVGIPAATKAPVVTGTPKVGVQLKTTSGSWARGPVAYRYDWQRCTAAGKSCVSIGTADATDDADYTPVAADAGRAIRVMVYATNTVGTAKSASSPTAPVAP